MNKYLFRFGLPGLLAMSMLAVFCYSAFSQDGDSTIPTFDKPVDSALPSAEVKTSEPVQAEPLPQDDWKAQGKKIMEERCGVCHAIPEVSAHTQHDWPGIINDMAPRAMLRPDEMKILQQYVQNIGQEQTSEPNTQPASIMDALR